MPRKRNTISSEAVETVKKKLLKNNFIAIQYPKDCEELSEHIFQVTGKKISASTLKRFLGFHSSPFAPAYDTIRICEEYLHIENNKLSSLQNTVDLIVNFFNPLHYEKINKADISLQATCRSIAIHIRSNPTLFEKVMEPIAASEFGRAFYYELFPDYDNLVAFQYKGFMKYLEYEKSYEGKIYGNAILFLKYFWEKDLVNLEKSWKLIMKLFNPSKHLHPLVLGRYYQVLLIGSKFFKPQQTNSILKEIFIIEKQISRDKTGLFYDFPGFHYNTCDGLRYTENYEELYKLSDIALNDFKHTDEFKWKGFYDHLYMFKSLALIKMGRREDARQLVSFINSKQFYFTCKAYFEKLLTDIKKELA